MLQNTNSVVLLERVVSHCEESVQRPPAKGRERDPRHPYGALLGGLRSPLSLTRWAEEGTRERRDGASNHWRYGCSACLSHKQRVKKILLQHVALPRSKALFLPQQCCLVASCLFILFPCFLIITFPAPSYCYSVENGTNQIISPLELGPVEWWLGKQVGALAYKFGISNDSHRPF